MPLFSSETAETYEDEPSEPFPFLTFPRDDDKASSTICVIPYGEVEFSVRRKSV